MTCWPHAQTIQCNVSLLLNVGTLPREWRVFITVCSAKVRRNMIFFLRSAAMIYQLIYRLNVRKSLAHYSYDHMIVKKEKS